MRITLFGQILSQLDRPSFKRLVNKHQSDKFNKGIDSWTHLVSMLFCHLGKADSNRDIANGLRSITGNLSHLGVTQSPSKSSISYINQNRSWQLFRDYYFELLETLEPSLAKKRAFTKQLKRKMLIMDSTLVPMCLELFDWAKYKQRKGAIKLHAVLDYETSLPVFMHITDGKVSDSRAAKAISIPSKSIVVMDRAYLDFELLNILDSKDSFFVTRMKHHVVTETLEAFDLEENESSILSDELVKLNGEKARKKYGKKPARVVKVYDAKRDTELVLLTNNFSWTAKTISELYKARWDIEVFFKHIKQSLKIKSFVGTSTNAVFVQIWTAMICILLLKYLQGKAKYPWHLSNLISFLRINLFVKIDLWYWVNYPFKPPNQINTQLTLFE